MDSIERAIRDALAKGDANDRAYREKVYRSILAALERANAENAKLTPEAIAHRRDALKAHITAIEQEFIPAVGPAVEPPAPSADRPAPAAAPEPRIDTPIRNEPAPPRHPAPETGIGATAEDRLAPEEESGGSKRKRPYAAMFVAVTFVAALAIGAWWATETGLFTQTDDGSVPNPPQELEEENFTPPPTSSEVAVPLDWTTLFEPSDPSTAITPSGAAAEVVEDDGDTYLSIRSGAGGDAVLFNVPADVLRQFAGGSAVFDIVARAEEGQGTQISITCNFGELGDCGRKRYLVGYEQADYLFDIDLPRGSPGADGTIAIVSDISNEGRVLHVYEIRAARR